MSKLVGLLLLAALIGGGVWVWQTQPELPFVGTPQSRITDLIEALPMPKDISTPPPLRMPHRESAGKLTVAGILAETNKQRAAEGVAALTGNSTLNQAAQKKVDDLFAQQYFEHVSPDGVGPADLVDSVGYEYIRVGENLALGGFSDDADVVGAWMDSPGHRENILNAGYTELGVAARRGEFEGATTWLAVQTFAKPVSACPTIDATAQATFDAKKESLEVTSDGLDERSAALDQRRSELAALADEIEILQTAGNKKIAEGNEQIQKGNQVYQQSGDESKARPYWDEGERLQQEGQELLAQAQRLRDSYNAQVQDFETERSAYNNAVAAQQNLAKELERLAAIINGQVTAFNACLESE